MSDLSKFLDFENPKYEAIPDIPLYMDQLLDYIQSQLAPLLRESEEAIFTKTMINNYVKAKVIDAPEKKKYQKSTISDLILVYHLKQCFSLQDIHILLDIFKADDDYYTQFSKHQKAILAQDDIEQLSTLSDNEKRAYIVSLSAEATIKKKLAEQLLDQISR